jgi:hypothetical protein
LQQADSIYETQKQYLFGRELLPEERERDLEAIVKEKIGKGK